LKTTRSGSHHLNQTASIRPALRQQTCPLTAIERDGTQGDLSGFKRIFRIVMPPAGGPVLKQDILNLNDIPDPSTISANTGLPGDIGLGPRFAFPFQTIESVLVLAPDLLAIANDNNYPFDFGRHVAIHTPADNELILVKLAAPLH
jgi:glycerophosphoryl diester phosphodiesterase